MWFIIQVAIGVFLGVLLSSIFGLLCSAIAKRMQPEPDKPRVKVDADVWDISEIMGMPKVKP